ncbi:hypothetical protein GOBAR_AA13492 [Gossypium barbadense]|uniref:SWIM-type domain-containing protein n=1 Tax=Gossypium barbadense TaxID=3634 RepID=A0A2P5XUZ1_GOSBA|nr:hypothetical protein GOBAR_AA13492 [Gossypium barbadense]
MDPIKFTEMELVDDEDVETMVALYCGTWSNQNAPIQLFAELAVVEETEDPTPLGEKDGAQEPCMVVPVSYVGSQSTIHGIDIDLNAAPETTVIGDDVYHSSDPSDHEVDSESDPDVDEVPDDIDDEGVNEEVNVNTSSVENQIRRIVIHNNPGAHMSRIDPDATHVAEFSEYPKIQSAHRMAVYSDPEELFIGQRFENKEEYVFAIKRSYGFDLRNRQCDCRRFQTLHYHCAHVVAACAKVSLNVDQFIDEVYTLERTLRVWENEFPVLPDLSTWEVPPTTFELVPDKGLRRNPKGRLQSSRIHNEMDIRDKSDGKLCGVCRLPGHNRNKCPLRNYHIGQSSRSDRN